MDEIYTLSYSCEQILLNQNGKSDGHLCLTLEQGNGEHPHWEQEHGDHQENIDHLDHEQENVDHQHNEQENVDHQHNEQENGELVDHEQKNCGHPKYDQEMVDNLDHDLENGKHHLDHEQENVDHQNLEQENDEHVDHEQKNGGHPKHKQENIDHLDHEQENVDHQHNEQENGEHVDHDLENGEHLNREHENVDHQNLEQENSEHVDHEQENVDHLEHEQGNIDHLNCKQKKDEHVDHHPNHEQENGNTLDVKKEIFNHLSHERENDYHLDHEQENGNDLIQEQKNCDHLDPEQESSKTLDHEKENGELLNHEQENCEHPDPEQKSGEHQNYEQDNCEHLNCEHKIGDHRKHEQENFEHVDHKQKNSEHVIHQRENAKNLDHEKENNEHLSHHHLENGEFLNQPQTNSKYLDVEHGKNLNQEQKNNENLPVIQDRKQEIGEYLNELKQNSSVYEHSVTADQSHEQLYVQTSDVMSDEQVKEHYGNLEPCQVPNNDFFENKQISSVIVTDLDETKSCTDNISVYQNKCQSGVSSNSEACNRMQMHQQLCQTDSENCVVVAPKCLKRNQNFELGDGHSTHRESEVNNYQPKQKISKIEDPIETAHLCSNDQEVPGLDDKSYPVKQHANGELPKSEDYINDDMTFYEDDKKLQDKAANSVCIYTCDTVLLDEDGQLFCSPVLKKCSTEKNTFAMDAEDDCHNELHECPQQPLFKWSAQDDVDVISQLCSSNNEIDKGATPELTTILPLQTCKKPLRVGLSRKMKVKPLHPQFKRK